MTYLNQVRELMIYVRLKALRFNYWGNLRYAKKKLHLFVWFGNFRINDVGNAG